ncbi:hypothetical protein SKAU_G00024310 [Synaphobranchus kaupii]|uniref:Uncharacterized protein n=1 Tax=Synaphobranchus kaupii TaxID=118154 RepID=A0A9Q1GDF0_SYNKA|nr:hypothetical protein SKAU_G00024310 [Synaphobranchus kaupii]
MAISLSGSISHLRVTPAVCRPGLLRLSGDPSPRPCHILSPVTLMKAILTSVTLTLISMRPQGRAVPAGPLWADLTMAEVMWSDADRTGAKVRHLFPWQPGAPQTREQVPSEIAHWDIRSQQ